MPTNPWRTITDHPSNPTSVLFIVDADHSVEEKLLNDWLTSTKLEHGCDIADTRVVVPIAHDPENIPTKKLAEHLAQSNNRLLVPIRILWKTKLDNIDGKPRLRDLITGNPRKPNSRKARSILDKDASRAIPIMGKPETYSTLKSQFEERRRNALVDKNLSDFIAGQASLALEVAERRLRGSRYKVPRQVSKIIRASDRYKNGLLKIMEKTGQTERALRDEAIPIFKELVSIPHNFWQDVSAILNRWVISLGYENEIVIDEDRLLRFRQIVQEHPAALLWTHKTHMDGLTMQAVLFENDFPTPHTMGGINMAFAGFGFLAKRSGAIFIRRSFQKNLVYKLVLRNYLSYLIEKRFPLTWSFEGTRSRVGKLMPPRYGMLKYVMEAVSDSNAENLHIIPVAINYDMINDVKDYAAEQSGAIKRPESLQWFISYIRRMRRPLGRIYVDFGEPVIVEKNAINDDPLQLAKTAFQVGVEANRVTPITLTSLMAMLLLGTAPKALTLEEMTKALVSLRNWARKRNIPISSDFRAKNFDHTRELIDAMVNIKLITRYDEGPETVYAVEADKHMIASYYRNTIVHHFVTKAIAELALVHASLSEACPLQEFWAEADRLKDLFKFEFFYAPSEEFRSDVDQELKRYNEAWQDNLTADHDYANEFLHDMTPLVAHSTLTPYVEAYRIVSDVLTGLDDDQTMDEKEIISAAFKYGNQAYLQRRISSKASIGKLLFQNAVKVMDSNELLDSSSSSKDSIDNDRKEFSRRLRILSHRLDHIRALQLPNEIE